MPRKKLTHATYFLLDLNSENLQNHYECLTTILAYKTKLIKKNKKCEDVMKLGFITRNNHKNIEEVVDSWIFYKMETLKTLHNIYVAKSEQKNEPGNVLDAVYEAGQNLELAEMPFIPEPKCIVLFSDLKANMSDKNVRTLKNFFLETDIWLYVIGPKVHVPFLESTEDVRRWSKDGTYDDKIENEIQRKNVKIMRQIINYGIIASEDVGIHLYFSYQSCSKEPFAWYADMRIGTEIVHKVKLVKICDDDASIKFHESKSTEDDQSDRTSRYKNPNTGEEVGLSTAGYLIQGERVILNAEKEKELSDHSEYNEDKCFDLKCFVKRSEVNPLYFDGEIHAVFSDNREDDYDEGLYALAEAMHNENVVAVIKRVYARGSQFSAMPYIVFTCEDHGPRCLLAAKWIFREDIIDYVEKKPARSLNTKSENIKDTVQKYLSCVTVNRDACDTDNDALYPLAEPLMEDPDVLKQCKLFMKFLIENKFEMVENDLSVECDIDKRGKKKDLGEQSKVDDKDDKKQKITTFEFPMDKVLMERSRKYVQELREVLKLKEEESENDNTKDNCNPS